MGVRIVHHVPGRMRLKVPAAKGRPALLEEIRSVYSDLPGIERVEFNPSTGSVTLYYDVDQRDDFRRGWSNRRQFQSQENWPSIDGIDDLARRLAGEAEFLAENSDLARSVVDFCKGFDREIKIITGNFIDLEILLAFGIVGFTILEVGATAATPIWVTIAIFGLHHFVELRQTNQPGLINAATARH